jgi:hypothetical protein
MVCLGDAERTVQGELLHYLREAKFNAISECGLEELESRKNRDIIVFRDDWFPACVIELKHYSANQGTTKRLVTEMNKDTARHINGPQRQLPLVQIGLFTEIAERFDPHVTPTQFGLYRFLASYCKRARKQTIEKQVLPMNFGGQLAATAPCAISLFGAVIVGRVGWIVF